MKETQVALVLVTALVLGTGGMLWRQGAISGVVAAAVAAATLVAAVFLFVTQ